MLRPQVLSTGDSLYDKPFFRRSWEKNLQQNQQGPGPSLSFAPYVKGTQLGPLFSYSAHEL